MKTFYITALLLWCSGITALQAQVGLMTNNPNENSVLDLNNTDGTNTKGLLLPKMALTSTTSPAPLTAHVAGMKVYNTATSGSGATAVTPGEYTNDGNQWVHMPISGWQLNGNNNGSLQNIGTNNALDLPIETNTAERMRITSNGQLLINTPTPLAGGTTAKVQLNNGSTAGVLQIQDGTQGNFKILTSDANGVASWAKTAHIPHEGWDLSNFTGSFTYPANKDTPETGTSTLSAYDGIGLTSAGNTLTVPAGRYIVYLFHDISIFEAGTFKLASPGGSYIKTIEYTGLLSICFIMDLPASTVLTPSFNPTSVAGTNPFAKTPYPSTCAFHLNMTFLKIK